jgi:putative ABC transport system ATP-binding protein
MNTTVQTPLIHIKTISKRFSSAKVAVFAVRDTSFTVRRGEFLAITGPSGSGKTTLAHIIGGLMKPSTGEVLFDDTTLPYHNDRELSRYRSRKVGFIFQNYHLIPHYTALENVQIPLISQGIARSVRIQKAKKLLEMVGLGGQQNQRATELSGGQKQRVAIARALVTNPQLLIADEPTGNLDTANGDAIMKLLEQLVAKKGLTLIMVTHNNMIAAQADRIISMQDGRIKEVVRARS